MDVDDRRTRVAAVRRALEETEHEYAQMPFFVRPLVKRGFEKRTGRDLASWRALVAQLDVSAPPGIDAALAALAEHYRGAPARARRGMGATAVQLREVEARAAARVAAVEALRAALAG
ncbi:MAG: hypothetical protein R3B06_04240 [Kofleriaceae bacterium]